MAVGIKPKHLKHPAPSTTPSPAPGSAEGGQGSYSFGNFLNTVKDASDTLWLRVGFKSQEQREKQYAAQKRLEKVYKTDYTTVKSVTKAALNEGSGQAGGYIVPLDFTYNLLKTVEEYSFFYPRANVIPSNEAEMMAPLFDAVTVPSAASIPPFFGNMQFKWGSEQAPSETEPKFRDVSLKAWDLLGYAILSNQFLMDTGPRGEEYLVKAFGHAAAWFAEYAFFQGTGTAQQMPLGILNSNAFLLTTSRSGSGAIAAADIANMAALLLPYSWSNAIWACSPTCLAKLVAITNYFVNAGYPEGPGMAGYLLGRPLFVTEKLPALGAAGDIVFFDPSLYVVGERQQVIVDVSEHTLFQNYQTVFRIWLRIDGKPMFSGPITLQDKTTQVSPFVGLHV